MREYEHQAAGTEVRFLAGRYTIVEERRIAHRGRELLCVVGVAAVDSGCCGIQGCRFINVPGAISDWKGRISDRGLAVSIVDPVADPAAKAEVRAQLARLFPHSQILFSA